MSTNQIRQYLDLLNEAETSSTFRGTLVANEPVIPGQPLSPIQMAMVDLDRSMGNQPRPEVQAAYDMAKKAGVTPGPGPGPGNLNQTGSGSEPRCAMCGTPQSQHQALKHPFVAGNAEDRPESVAQGGGGGGGGSGGGGGVDRIKQMQAELKAAGAYLGPTGKNRDGIDGDIGDLTTIAMAKYPDIAAKYSDLNDSPLAQASTPAVDTSKLTAALSAIESIVAKYKGKTKVSESRIYEVNPTDFKPRITVKQGETQDDAVKRTRAEKAPFDQMAGKLKSMAPPEKSSSGGTIQQTAKGLTHTAGRNNPAAGAASSPAVKYNVPTGGIPSVNSNLPQPAVAPKTTTQTVQPKPSSWTSNVGKKILSKLPGLGARTAGRAGATAVSGPLAPLVGAAGVAYTVWDIGKMLYDAFKDSDNLEGMNDADQAVIKQNLAVVMSFMKDPKVADTLPQDIKTRVENVMTDLEKLAVDTGYATPAAAQQAATPAATPNAVAAPAAKVAAAAKLAPTLDGIDKLLKKYNFESKDFDSFFDSLTENEQRKFILKNLHLLSESEQMAERRDMLNEAGAWGLGQKGLRWLGHKLYKAGGGIVGPPVPAAGKTPWWKPGFKTGAAVGVGGAVFGYFAIKQILSSLLDTIKDPETAKVITITPEDTAAWIQFNRELEAALPDQAAYNALPQETKDRLSMIAARAEAMDKAMRASRKTTQ
jgi:hypothetical protein